MSGLRGANLEGANLEGANLERASLREANLREASLEGADLRGAILDGANLQEATLNEANLLGVKLVGAILEQASFGRAAFGVTDLNGANLKRANLERANVVLTSLRGDLEGADLEGANLKEANLNGTNLKGASLYGADLERADITGAHEYRFDSTLAKDLRMRPWATDPWSEIRRSYTGPMLAFHLMLLVAFLLPYVGQAIWWSAVGTAQQALMRSEGRVESVLTQAQRGSAQVADRVGAKGPAAAIAAVEPSEKMDFGPCLGPWWKCREYRLWEVMIGKHKGWAVWFFAAVLLVYNTFRAALTWWVSLLRDQEERSGYTPSWSWWNGYRLASTVHRYGMVPLVGVGITLAAIHGYHALHYGVVYLQR